MRALIRSFDLLLRRRLGVFEFSDDPDCLLRIRLAKAPHALSFPDEVVSEGAPVIELHLWSEHIPLPPVSGPDLAWALKGRHLMMHSLRNLAAIMRNDARFAGIQAVGSVSVLILIGDQAGVSIMQRLGFTISPYRHRLGRFGEFWENLYTAALMWAFNPASLHGRSLFGLKRAEFWMPASDFLHRYGKPAGLENHTPKLEAAAAS